MQSFLYCVWPLRCIFNYFTPEMAIINSLENYCNGRNFKLFQKTTYNKLVLKYQDNARFPFFVFGLCECIFELIISSRKTAIINLVKNNRITKKEACCEKYVSEAFPTIPGKCKVFIHCL